MNMKEHILAALGEQVNGWEEFLAGLPAPVPQAQVDAAQLVAPLLPSHWSPKDELAHLHAWQERSIARLEAALSSHEPDFPAWLPGVDPDLEENTEQINDFLYTRAREQPWEEVHRDWKEGYLHLIELGKRVEEKDLLDSGRYAWLGGKPLVFILLATYDHHQEHLETMAAWYEAQGIGIKRKNHG